MTKSTSRRAVLAMSGAAFAATAISEVAGVAVPDDAVLLALRPSWLAGLAAYESALEAHSPVEDRAMLRYPAYPDHADRSAEAARRRIEVKAAREVIAAEEGLDEAQRRQNEAQDADAVMVDRIAEMPAHTLAGIRFKVEVSTNWDHNHPELIDSIMDDIVALSGSAS